MLSLNFHRKDGTSHDSHHDADLQEISASIDFIKREGCESSPL